MGDYRFHFLIKDRLEEFKFLVIEGDVALSDVTIDSPHKPADTPAPQPPGVSIFTGIFEL